MVFYTKVFSLFCLFLFVLEMFSFSVVAQGSMGGTSNVGGLAGLEKYYRVNYESLGKSLEDLKDVSKEIEYGQMKIGEYMDEISDVESELKKFGARKADISEQYWELPKQKETFLKRLAELDRSLDGAVDKLSDLNSRLAKLIQTGYGESAEAKSLEKEMDDIGKDISRLKVEKGYMQQNIVEVERRAGELFDELKVVDGEINKLGALKSSRNELIKSTAEHIKQLKSERNFILKSVEALKGTLSSLKTQIESYGQFYSRLVKESTLFSKFGKALGGLFKKLPYVGALLAAPDVSRGATEAGSGDYSSAIVSIDQAFNPLHILADLVNLLSDKNAKFVEGLSEKDFERYLQSLAMP